MKGEGHQMRSPEDRVHTMAMYARSKFRDNAKHYAEIELAFGVVKLELNDTVLKINYVEHQQLICVNPK